MSTTTFHSPPGRALPEHAAAEPAAHRRRRPPEGEVAGFRGLVFATLLVLPLWLIVALVVALA